MLTKDNFHVNNNFTTVIPGKSTKLLPMDVYIATYLSNFLEKNIDSNFSGVDRKINSELIKFAMIRCMK